MGIDLNEDPFCGMNVHLQTAGFIQRRIEQSEETLHRCEIHPRKFT